MKTLYPRKANQLWLWGQLTLVLLALMLLLIMSIYAINEFAKKATDSSEDFAIVRVLSDTFRSSNSDMEESAQLPRKVRQVEVSGISSVSQQGARSDDSAKVAINQTSSTETAVKSPQNYYEEQMPVLVHSESKQILGYRQAPGVPTKQEDSTESDPYYSDYLSDDQLNDQAIDDQQQEGDYETQDVNYYDRGQMSDYYSDDAGEVKDDVGSALSEYSADAAPRSVAAPQRQYDNYYRQWHTQATAKPSYAAEENRRLSQRIGFGPGNRDAVDIYSDYDYTARPQTAASTYANAQRTVQTQQQLQQQQQQSLKQQTLQQQLQPRQKFYPQLYRQRLQQSQQNRATSTTTTATPTTQRPQESTLLSVVKQLKNLWDIYQAFSTAWNIIAEHSQRTQQQQQQQQHQQQQQKQQLEQQQQQQKLEREQQQKTEQLRINSKQPPKFTATAATQKRNNSTIKTTKTKTATTAKTATTTTTTTSELPPAINEPRHRVDADDIDIDVDGDVDGDAAAAASGEDYEILAKRKKRQSSDQAAPIEQHESNEGKAVEEGRYITGDPLKGYYDFVITEGSYKFWAAFQVGTAILIIYSTFAAIYYSKVNPLVSDYDYTDYLGGARSLGSSDLDFVDDDAADADAPTGAGERTSRWLDLLPNMGHSVKFILDAIDKLPVDHANVQS